MKERPILFSAPMVRALLTGRKTQTRRPAKFIAREGVNLDFSGLEVGHYCTGHPETGWVLRSRGAGSCWNDRTERLFCPYGAPGDRLWVRENGWERPERDARMMREGADTWARYYYDADDCEAEDLKAWGFKRRPSIHMPRWASRLTLEVKGIRVERLRSISDADCIAEGCPGGHGAIAGYPYHATPREHYFQVFHAVNGSKDKGSNPWVWVVEFVHCDSGTTATNNRSVNGNPKSPLKI